MMRVNKKMRKIEGRRDKRGLSNLVAYVLLITITISLSVLVYGWLKFYVESEDVVDCPSGVNIVIDGYDCSLSPSKTLEVRLKNKGLFNVDGFVLRFHNRTDAKFGLYVLDDRGVFLSPGDNVSRTYAFAGGDVTFIDVQPFLLDGEKISCGVYASQRIVCS